MLINASALSFPCSASHLSLRALGLKSLICNGFCSICHEPRLVNAYETSSVLTKLPIQSLIKLKNGLHLLKALHSSPKSWLNNDDRWMSWNSTAGVGRKGGRSFTRNRCKVFNNSRSISYSMKVTWNSIHNNTLYKTIRKKALKWIARN